MTLRILALALAGLLAGAAPALADLASAIAAQERGDFEVAYRELRPLAEAGNAEAQWRVGNLLYSGAGVARDTREAVRWFRRAADQGHGWGMFGLAHAYDFGDPFDRDPDEALRWYRMAAERGIGEAQLLLGNAHNYGWLGVHPRPEEAQRWYARAFATFKREELKGSLDVHLFLGAMYQMGHGVEQDLREALQHFHVAAEADIDIAQHVLGWWYMPISSHIMDDLEHPRPGPDILEPDSIESYKWFALAARHGNESAIFARDWLAERMAPEALAEAMRRVEAWQPRQSGLRTE